MKGMDYTGYAIRKHSSCGTVTRIATPRTGNVTTFSPAEIQTMGALVRDGARRFGSDSVHADDLSIPCPHCGKGIRFTAFEPIFGRYVADVACNGKCMAATRPNGECSCGGKNHGGGHSGGW